MSFFLLTLSPGYEKMRKNTKKWPKMTKIQLSKSPSFLTRTTLFQETKMAKNDEKTRKKAVFWKNEKKVKKFKRRTYHKFYKK